MANYTSAALRHNMHLILQSSLNSPSSNHIYTRKPNDAPSNQDAKIQPEAILSPKHNGTGALYAVPEGQRVSILVEVVHQLERRERARRVGDQPYVQKVHGPFHPDVRAQRLEDEPAGAHCEEV